eukprot:scaffold284192_cov83-Cyclotella_meneghiniana.AAC.1
MLYSNSVVFMPTPTRTSWAMEEKLIPYIHYVPVAQDLSNLLEMIEWAKQNDDIVQLISQKSTEYMEHLYVSDQAKLDHQEIIIKLANSYTSRFKDSLSDCLLLLGNKESALDSYDDVNSDHPVSSLGGHWEYHEKTPAELPYTYSEQVCNHTSLERHVDCKSKFCPLDLMNWRYIDSNSNMPYPKFDADGFRTKLQNKRMIFVGDSTMRQQVLALIWTLGHDKVDWEKFDLNIPQEKSVLWRNCMVDHLSNITICYQFVRTMAKSTYYEDNYTLDFSLMRKDRIGNDPDTSFLLNEEMIDQLAEFDFVFIQGVTWYTHQLLTVLDSIKSPREWIVKMLPRLYKDAIGSLLSKISSRTNTILTLGQVGSDCRNKTKPEPYNSDKIPERFGWNIAPKLWNASLDVIKEQSLNVKVIDARDPLMQSVQAHPSPDCLHFCMNSAAINIYLDMYWNEIFS